MSRGESETGSGSSEGPFALFPRRPWGRGDLVALLVWTLAIAVYFWDVVGLRRALFYFDITEINYPYRAFFAEELKAGRFSRWFPGLYCGLPLFSESQAGYLHPFKYLLYPWLATWQALNLDTVLSIWLTGAGAISGCAGMWARGGVDRGRGLRPEWIHVGPFDSHQYDQRDGKRPVRDLGIGVLVGVGTLALGGAGWRSFGLSSVCRPPSGRPPHGRSGWLLWPLPRRYRARLEGPVHRFGHGGQPGRRGRTGLGGPVGPVQGAARSVPPRRGAALGRVGLWIVGPRAVADPRGPRGLRHPRTRYRLVGRLLPLSRDECIYGLDRHGPGGRRGRWDGGARPLGEFLGGARRNRDRANAGQVHVLIRPSQSNSGPGQLA